MKSAPTYNLFPEITPFYHDWLAVSPLHQMYYEECGNLEGFPVVFLHGGPGSGCNPGQRRFFDPKRYRIILLDQRGCGRSNPQGSTEENTTSHLISDIEALRHHLKIDRWLVFGGSWGSTLAIAYALRHPTAVAGLILRGIFLSRQQELTWFLNEVKQFYPESWEALTEYLPAHERNDLMQHYANRIFSEDKNVSIPAARNWNAFESSIMTLFPATNSGTSVSDEVELARARVQLHYLLNDCFVSEMGLLEQAANLGNIPTWIVQGRYDMVCPPLTAWELKQKMPHATFSMIPDAGHSGMEPGTASALVAATEAFKQYI